MYIYIYTYIYICVYIYIYTHMNSIHWWCIYIYIYFYPGLKSVELHPWNLRHLTSQRCCPKFMSEMARFLGIL